MRFHFWYLVLSLFYIALAVLAYMNLEAAGKLGTWIPFGDFMLMALAISRLVRLLSYDNFTAYIREALASPDPMSLRGTLASLMGCPWCTGLWAALLVVYFYFLTPITWYALVVLALAAVGSCIQITINLIGWHAEGKKREVQGIPLPR